MPPHLTLDPSSTPFIGAVEDHWELFSDNAEDYTPDAPIGFGASSIVYSATYKPSGATKPIPCALKVLNLDQLPPRSLALLQRETTLMSLSKHPNVLRVRGSWIDGHNLYIALRLMSKGSAADVMQYGWPGGLEEDVIRCILRQALLGLNYLHTNDFIHRDIKAANLLIDDDGTVLLGDLGVAADLAEDPLHHSSSHSHRSHHRTTAQAAVSEPGIQHHFTSSDVPNKRTMVNDPSTRPKMGKRKSFVGTPCWMAPELIQGKQYDSSADIWSFGITALELAQGRPPRSREHAKDVLLKIIQDAPPVLDRDGGDYKYSKSFQEVLEACLVKDPSKRPTAEQLLQMPFFKNAKKPSYLVGAILKDLPPLAQRQERRQLNTHSITRASIDSWDFTIHTARRSSFPSPRSELATVLSSDEGGIFDMEDDVLSHAKAIHPLVAFVSAPEVDSDGGVEPSSPPDSSASDSPEDSDYIASQTSGTSPASSFIPSNVKLTDARPVPLPATRPDDSSMHPLAASCPITKTLSHVPSISSFSTSSAVTPSSSSQSGLWTRLKKVARSGKDKK